MRAGDRIDHYRIERDLGAGAFATVWLATDEYLDAPVAIKILADNWARNPDVRERFIDEAKIMRRIDHERIVRVYAVAELPTGQPMFVMTYADRGTLAARISDRRHQARRFFPDEVARIAIELASCLSVVHDFGIVHRDLKPSNVLYRSPRLHDLVDTGTVPDDVAHDDSVMVLADFGLAKDVVAESGFTLAAGTPAYMPPEQARSTADLDARADIYSATAIVYELLTGRPPFDASSLSGVGSSRAASLRRLDASGLDLSERWQELIDRGLADSPGDRFSSAADFADAVRAALDGNEIDGRSASSSVAVRPPPVLDDGVRGRVGEVLARFAGHRPIAVDERLSGPRTVAVVDDRDGVGELSRLVEPSGLTILQLGPDDVRLGEVDLVVVGDGVDVTPIADMLREAPAGPVAMIVRGDGDGDGDGDADARIASAAAAVAGRGDLIGASAALTTLDWTVRQAGSAALSEAWVRVGALVESVRFDVPELEEIATLRDVTSGRVKLPETRSRELQRVLLEVEPAKRLGLDPDADLATMTASALEALGRWRDHQDSGRVTFGARPAVDTVVRSLERLWASLSGYSG